jgi:hypothetical protein
MHHDKKEQKSTEGQSKSTTSRFHIEKLEERIAPAKGGIPGKPGDTTCYYGCYHKGKGRYPGHNV